MAARLGRQDGGNELPFLIHFVDFSSCGPTSLVLFGLIRCNKQHEAPDEPQVQIANTVIANAMFLFGCNGLTLHHTQRSRMDSAYIVVYQVSSF